MILIGLTNKRKQDMRKIALAFFGFSFVFISLFILTGCASQRVPQPMDIRADKVTSYDVNGSLYVKNVQTETQQMDFGQIGVVEVKGDLHSWTETAVKVLKSELIKRGAQIDNQAPTGLQISVDKVEMGVAGLQFAGMPKGKVFLSVKTDKGYSSIYEGEYTTISAYKTGDGAIMAALEAMLNDPVIQLYLQELSRK